MSGTLPCEHRYAARTYERHPTEHAITVTCDECGKRSTTAMRPERPLVVESFDTMSSTRSTYVLGPAAVDPMLVREQLAQLVYAAIYRERYPRAMSPQLPASAIDDSIARQARRAADDVLAEYRVDPRERAR